MRRFNQLDSLRGIASVQVLIHHVLLILPILFASSLNYDASLNAWQASPHIKEKVAYYLTYTPLHFAWLGSAAVSFFFLLSGFVLSISLSGSFKPTEYLPYLIKRFFRLYLLFVLTIGLSLVLRALFFSETAPVGHLSVWFQEIWRKPVSLRQFIDLITFQNRDTHNVVTTLWSIEIEIKLSLILPFILGLFNLMNRFSVFRPIWHLILWIGAFLISHNAGKYFPNDPSIYYDSFVLSHLFAFITGVVIYKYAPAFISAFEKSTRLELFILLSIAIVLHCCYWVGWWIWYNEFLNPLLFFLNDIIVISSALFLLLSFNKSAHNFLTQKPMLFFGKISYSLYLIHPIVLSTLIYLLSGHIPLKLIMVLIILCSIGMAVLTQKYVEQPINELGRYVAKRIKGRDAIDKPAP